MIILFILDILLYSTISINIPLILILFPFEKNILNISIISILLLLIDLHYWVFILILFIIFFINQLIKSKLRFNLYTYLIILTMDFIFYYLFVGVINA